jgi:hypothetical protein
MESMMIEVSRMIEMTRGRSVRHNYRMRPLLLNATYTALWLRVLVPINLMQPCLLVWTFM